MPPDAAPRPAPQREPAPQAGMGASVALRDLTLVDSVLTQLEGMEPNEKHPDALARLYQLDHLAARIRRNAEKLRVRVGHGASSTAGAPSPLIDVIRVAISSIRQEHRITIGSVPALAVVEVAADDLSRLLAELLDNATSYSPETSTVAVSARLTTQGSILVFIEDAGIGLSADQRQAFNIMFYQASSMNPEPTEQTGFAVVCRLASQHGFRVRVDMPGNQGTTAVVLVPSTLLCEPPAMP
jgi:K+-sensing histidine kinase KdpD